MSVLIVGQSALASFLKLIMLFIAFILILVASYYVTKWYAKSGFIRKQTNNMEIVDTFSMGPNRQICILRIGQRYVAVSVCKEQINFLMEIPEEELQFESEMPAAAEMPFKDILKEMAEKCFLPKGKGNKKDN